MQKLEFSAPSWTSVKIDHSIFFFNFFRNIEFISSFFRIPLARGGTSIWQVLVLLFPSSNCIKTRVDLVEYFFFFLSNSHVTTPREHFREIRNIFEFQSVPSDFLGTHFLTLNLILFMDETFLRRKRCLRRRKIGLKVSKIYHCLCFQPFFCWYRLRFNIKLYIFRKCKSWVIEWYINFLWFIIKNHENSR